MEKGATNMSVDPVGSVRVYVVLKLKEREMSSNIIARTTSKSTEP
jgi:hypothetical protein